jgi:hypothetical protein
MDCIVPVRSSISSWAASVKRRPEGFYNISAAPSGIGAITITSCPPCGRKGRGHRDFHDSGILSRWLTTGRAARTPRGPGTGSPAPALWASSPSRERNSRNGDRANTTNPIDVKNGIHAAPYGANAVMRRWFYRHAAPTVLGSIGNFGIYNSVICFSGSEVIYSRFRDRPLFHQPHSSHGSPRSLALLKQPFWQSSRSETSPIAKPVWLWSGFGLEIRQILPVPMNLTLSSRCFPKKYLLCLSWIFHSVFDTSS